MKELSEIDVYYCKLQGAIAHVNSLRKLHLLSWKKALSLFFDWLSKDELFSKDAEFVKRIGRFYNSECDGSHFSAYVFYLTNRKMFHSFDISFLRQSCDDFAVFGFFLEDLI